MNLSVKSPSRYGAVLVVPRPLKFQDKITPKEREYLVIRRSEKVIAPNKLCFPGGGIEENESPQEAGVREFREEVGGEIKIIREIWENLTPWNVYLHWFLAELISSENKLICNTREVSEILWMKPRDLLFSKDTLESNTPFLTSVLNESISLFF